MPTSITIADSNDITRTTVFFTNTVYKHLQKTKDSLFKGQVLRKSELQKKYDELRKVDEEALKYSNLGHLEESDPEFFSVYLEEREKYSKDTNLFARKMFKGISKSCLGISSGDDSLAIFKISDREKQHAFILEDIYLIFDKEGVSVKAAKEFLKNSSEPYTIRQIFSY